MMRTMEVTLNESLFKRLEQAARLTGVPFSEFVQQMLKRSLQEWTVEELERQEIEAYQRLPVTPGEFDVWDAEQSWGEA
jgi:metal-responsive CopG/Arc/MetJ family transcriptional regulator